MSDDYIYGSKAMVSGVPKDRFPEEGLPANVAYHMVMDEMNLDGNPNQNLASFVTTWMEPEAEKIMIHGMSKNIIDIDEYSQSAELGHRCVNMLSHLFNAPGDGPGIGTATIGSSEAIMLAGLAMKWRWKEARKKAGKPFDNPNCVFGSNVQICWHKMCRYLEIECREADVATDSLVLTAETARPLIDENTIAVCPILGSTINGEYEDVKQIHDMVQALNEKNGWVCAIHVDAASGGFIAPFIEPDLVWDFRLPLVKSINTSGHKYGLVYAGIGWILFRDADSLPDDLIFRVNYLGGDQASFTLNFSRGASHILGQYYQIVRLGFKGYKRVMEASMMNAQYLRTRLVDTGKFNIHDKGHMPLVAFALKDLASFNEFDVQHRLKARGWIVPAYTCPKGATKLTIMRVVVKQNFSRDMVDLLMDDILAVVKYLELHPTHSALNSPVVLDKLPGKRKSVLGIPSTFPVQGNVAHQQSQSSTTGVC